jgi:GH15 family glucan-1,4-alpha-glucosidase
MKNLNQASIDFILTNQAPSGAYIACPNFTSYHYSWFRDGSFIAYAMNLVGEHASAGRFHAWVAETLLKRVGMIQAVLEKIENGAEIEPQDVLHTRYTLDGEDGVKEEWPNFQLDGFGTWLWALRQHQLLSGQPLPQKCLDAADWIGLYLRALWPQPCYDCWEEFPRDVHTHTLAAIYGGFQALADFGFEAYRADAEQVQAYILENCVYDGYFVKYIGSYTVDASLLGLTLPYQVVTLDDDRFRATVERIESSLLKEGGVQRYPTDTYFGGGEWILLTAWLGWIYAEMDEVEKAAACQEWIEKQANQNQELPEQVPLVLNDPNYYLPWVRQWGEIASPLLWSHAKYLILGHVLKTVSGA